MKEREMKIAKEMIEKGVGEHRYDRDQILFRLSIEIPNENMIVSRFFRKFILLSDKISQPAMLSESVARSISER